MAKKGSVVAEGTERVYIVPLRKMVLKQRRSQKTNRAVRTIRQFLERHMKAETVKISPKLNDALWTRGVHKPPSRIRLKAKKDDKGVVTARLPDEKEVVKKGKKSRLEALKDAALSKKSPEAKTKEEKPTTKEKVKEAVRVPSKDETVAKADVPNRMGIAKVATNRDKKSNQKK